MDHVSSLLLLGIYVGFCLAYFLLKWLLYMFLGWTFFDKIRQMYGWNRILRSYIMSDLPFSRSCFSWFILI